jgi:hypothetical protein
MSLIMGSKRALFETLSWVGTAALGLALAPAPSALAHHSFAMFDGENQITIRGTVIDYKFANPHAFILLRMKDDKGAETSWSLEGASAASLARDGWNGRTLKAGDELIMKISPLRSGAPGGAWETKDTTLPNGKPVVSR